VWRRSSWLNRKLLYRGSQCAVRARSIDLGCRSALENEALACPCAPSCRYCHWMRILRPALPF